MSYCLNPNCPQPQNHPEVKVCKACGSQLLLKDRYRAISFLDSGGMSRNFLAVDTDMPEEKRCVIKQFFPAPQVLDDVEAFEKSIELFQREGAQLDRLGADSSQIPQLFAYLEQERRFYLIQEFIDGQNLLKELDENGAYSEEKILQLLDDILPILKFVHDRGVIHRDIKPENIMRRKNGQLVVIDFGMSKHLNSTVMSRGTTGGTMGYAPPEQIRAGVAYPASDIYALGATCIHLLTNITPDRLYDFMSNKWTWRQELVAQERQISDRLASAIDRMLMNEVQDRHQSISCIEAALALPPVNNWRLKAIIGTAILAIISTGLVAYANKNFLECQLGGHNTSCPLPPPPMKLQTPQKIGNVLYYPYLSAKDRNGKSAEINMAVLSDRYEWQLASDTQVRLKGSTQSLPIAVLKQELEKQGIFKIMDNPNRIVAIGTASCEGTNAEEELRALSRAKTIQDQIVKQLFQVKEYPILNLGQFKRDNCQRDTAGTSIQRSLVIVGLRKESEGLMVKEAVYQRLSKTIKNLKLDDYSLGSVQKFELK
ncbi:serine/threonine-protein kinase [Chamaesiphon minutus]|uniref:non-specific serine/threonine protein kinase n=1 Tax=Chamaesiphon minutus (strain ATCC 27169 / PCC 6605) TaxID=1173020 RepID=K9UJ48_CHAP6|nr:serine/threonine-protein kinase [Chamaesiphon minutus]AFY94688.1 protein kinase family protein [Chamaesiphon minutus PCC 6605]